VSYHLVRPAAAGDIAAIAAAQHTDPEPELVGLTGSVDRARALGSALTHAYGIESPDRPHVVVEVAGSVAGFLAWSRGSAQTGDLSGPVIWAAVKACGVHAPALAWRLRIRNRVIVHAPTDSFYIAELHLHPDHRGRGLGDALLTWAVAEASRLAMPMSLATTIGNPAQRLYERNGFEVTERRTDPGYERMTGRAGRVLMVRSS
jgi:ribosomal protein S18 acetylase RimI-like enzyme